MQSVGSFALAVEKPMDSFSEGATSELKFLNEADEEIRTLDPLLGKEMLYH